MCLFFIMFKMVILHKNRYIKLSKIAENKINVKKCNILDCKCVI